ncbi:putative receptor-like protein kinase At4g00960 [Papaver somniferum]|uniref:putative receptor-like protein kinase At4g00960 n=1 Tax=Papaver somniferum TaxID=3469 RepID=UPI000E6FECBF|nr:putative receptor-like protein kinase At4g00960 [Papaver somniferum]
MGNSRFFNMFIKILSAILICYALKANAQTDTENVYHSCSGGNYIANSTYESIVKLLLSSLKDSFNKGTIRNGYYNNTIVRRSNTMYGSYQCRGYIRHQECEESVVSAANEIALLCPTSKQAAISYKDLVVLQFSDKLFFSILQDKPLFTLPSEELVPNPDEFNPKLDLLKIYGLAQCSSDLSVDNCNRCLRGGINDIQKRFSGRIGGKVITWSCYFRYKLFPFYTKYATSPAPANPPQPSITRTPVENPPQPSITRTPVANPPQPSISKAKQKPKMSLTVLLIIVVPTVITVVSIITILCFCIIRRKKISNIGEIQSAESLQFKFSTISAATNNFSDANKLGRGGFGIVYKGTLTDGQEIAVKRLSENSGQGEKEFKNEVALLIKLQHKNLVRLLGYCLHGDEKLLVYEFMKNGSLDQFLFDPFKCAHLDWGKRHMIIGGIAKGLLYLHEDSRLNIIHRDLKASNVLLGPDMVPKIADFGMAKIFMVNQSQASTKRVCGTFGYMAPEYAMLGKFSVKSDVFSFGVLILEILCGKRSNSFGRDEDAESILTYAWKLWNEGKYLELLDPTLRGHHSTSEVMRCIEIALLCVQEDVAERPAMARIVHILNNYSVTVAAPLTPSAFSLSNDNRTEPNIPSQGVGNVSVNEMSTTELYPR